MATIYRFIVEGKGGNGGGKVSGGRKSTSGSKKKVGKNVGIFSSFLGNKGGVEHNRKLRAINPLVNKLTGGYWEKGMRLGRASLGLVQRNTETGKISLSGVSIAIIIAFIIQSVLKAQNYFIQKANETNQRNYKALMNGQAQVRSTQRISENIFSGRINYNENR